jgi:hypothetical protein
VVHAHRLGEGPRRAVARRPERQLHHRRVGELREPLVDEQSVALGNVDTAHGADHLEQHDAHDGDGEPRTGPRTETPAEPADGQRHEQGGGHEGHDREARGHPHALESGDVAVEQPERSGHPAGAGAHR